MKVLLTLHTGSDPVKIVQKIFISPNISEIIKKHLKDVFIGYWHFLIGITQPLKKIIENYLKNKFS